MFLLLHRDAINRCEDTENAVQWNGNEASEAQDSASLASAPHLPAFSLSPTCRSSGRMRMEDNPGWQRRQPQPFPAGEEGSLFQGCGRGEHMAGGRSHVLSYPSHPCILLSRVAVPDLVITHELCHCNLGRCSSEKRMMAVGAVEREVGGVCVLSWELPFVSCFCSLPIEASILPFIARNPVSPSSRHPHGPTTSPILRGPLSFASIAQQPQGKATSAPPPTGFSSGFWYHT